MGEPHQVGIRAGRIDNDEVVVLLDSAHCLGEGGEFLRFDFVEAQPSGSASIVVREELAAIPLVGIVDVAAETARLEKEIAREQQEVAKVDAKLANAEFVAKAPEEVVEENRERREASRERIAKMAGALARLKQI